MSAAQPPLEVRFTKVGCPTDSSRSRSNFDHLGGFGVDTIRFRGPVPPGAFRAATKQNFTVRVDRKTGEVSPLRPTVGSFKMDSGARLEMRRIADRPTAAVEFSVPGLLRGDNARPATYGEVLAAVHATYKEAASLVEWECDVDELEVVRLDIARDFRGVVDAPTMLEQLSHLRAPGRVDVWRTKDCAGAQTVYRRTERWVARLYDRGRMYKNLAGTRGAAQERRMLALGAQEAGTVRYELELRSRLLKAEGLNRLSSLEPSVLEGYSVAYFNKLRFGDAVGGAKGRIRQAATEAQTQGPDAYRSFGLGLTIAMLDSLGLPPTATSRATVRKHRAAAAAFGISAADLFEAGPARRLDFQSGAVVAAHMGVGCSSQAA